MKTFANVLTVLFLLGLAVTPFAYRAYTEAPAGSAAESNNLAGMIVLVVALVGCGVAVFFLRRSLTQKRRRFRGYEG